MGEFIQFEIDGKECMAEQGAYLIDAAQANGVYIPFLCNMKGVIPKGACRICSVLVNGKRVTACTTKVSQGMEVIATSKELEDYRKSIVELLFVEGNHLCPSCERSGNCDLQALGYRYRMMNPRFPYLNPDREIEAKNPKLMKDHNRGILCKRCIRVIKNTEGKSLFAFGRRGHKVQISIDTELAAGISDELAEKAMAICPVGAIIRKGKGFAVPIGKRKYDHAPIGSEIEAQ